MTEQSRLQEWLQKNNLTAGALAHKLGMAYVPVWRMVRGDRGFSDGFKLRFLTLYGMETSREIFDMPSVTEPEPAP